MRSRNGNFPFLFSGFTLIFTLAIKADDYYIGYRLTAKNTQAINETLSVSKAMQPCGSLDNSALLVLKHTPDETLETVLKREETTFLEFASYQELHVKSNDRFSASNVHSLNSLTLPTKCYAVEFNNESVTITATK
ncbi:hypothetical protein Sulku_2085 [Sulfuricurvum kujiense DSM 16994]|uniref:Uncharacterized protein n=1 Tax=Sulfuricurvum kujiense (strain ATCC BAA-921 / DSM 16994 / JCM 11577 / YK-1) TaxID=709032 RepID=E4U2Y1_SULKY|nr:hypothetical protein [Sulfuricurvum kujiense]ADR34745.1 hypothetical protein Sulku_2085 [Sulfuricurvum kujiense DSM 16994]